MGAPRHSHAIVIGGSMAGLMTTRVLSEHFERVTLIERDALPDANASRKGVPQGRHVHGLLAFGLTNMRHYFPDLREALAADGAVVGDMAERFRWHQYGTYKLQYNSGFEGVFMSRPLLEQHVRRRVLALPNVKVLASTDVEGIIFNSDRTRVTGVQLRGDVSGKPGESIDAALVVDCTGRGSRSPAWLEQAGYVRPQESSVHIDIGYATRIFRRKPSDLPNADAVMISASPPLTRRMGVLFPIEGDRWICSLGGWHGDHAPTDEAGFMRYAKELGASDIYDIVSRAEPLGPVESYRFPASLRRHYERLTRFPDGYLVLGDAISSFNPTYGQGMTSATLQARALDRLLTSLGSQALDGVWRSFFKAAEKVVSIPWDVVAGEDFRFTETTGARPPMAGLINRYVAQVQKASGEDPVVYNAFLHVMNLQKAPPSVFAPRVVGHVIARGVARWWKGRAQQRAQSADTSAVAGAAHIGV